MGHTEGVGPSGWKGVGSLTRSLYPAPPASTELQAACCEIQGENCFSRLYPLWGKLLQKTKRSCKVAHV